MPQNAPTAAETPYGLPGVILSANCPGADPGDYGQGGRQAAKPDRAEQAIYQRVYNQPMSTPKLTPTQVCGLLDIPLFTLRKLSNELSGGLSPTANPPKGGKRSYTVEDVDLLRPAVLLAKQDAERAERARIIAYTERARYMTQAELNKGEKLARQYRDMLVTKRWFTCNDHLVCPICKTFHVSEILIDKKFKAGGQEFDGPPAHEGCRCWISVGLRFRMEKPG
jgi:hypothetical protein